jgi:hypothetical protein
LLRIARLHQSSKKRPAQYAVLYSQKHSKSTMNERTLYTHAKVFRTMGKILDESKIVQEDFYALLPWYKNFSIFFHTTLFFVRIITMSTKHV